MPPFRLLDLGVCDGAFPLWLDRELDHGVHVDGMDLDRRQIKIAKRRARKHKLPGTFKQANALTATEHFPTGSYDAVCAYELIEHVPDPVELLRVCEQMVKPNGRIYISTPDGTFGDGNNPHHLRALRAIDLADMLRRRGALMDMAVGSDGVTVASYTPRPRREDIAIYTGPGWEPWHPTDPELRGLGGSETATIRLAEALSELGFIVTVYGELREDTCFKDIIFRHHAKFDPLDSRAVLISSRIPEVYDRPCAAGVRVLWVHDIDCADRLTPARADRIDHVLALSRFHLHHLAGRYPWLAETGKLLETHNAIRHSDFTPKPWADRAKRVLYTSSPDRGLDILLEEWPRVLEQVPDAELHHCYAAVYDRIADQDPAIARHRDKIRALADQPGVIRLEPQSQPALAALMCDSRVWAHPSWVGTADIPFHETSCIGAMEAQAAGCHIVASDWGALPETVRYGRLINSDPPGPRWRDALVSHIVEGLINEKAGQAAVDHAPGGVQDLTWAHVAEGIAAMLPATAPAPAPVEA